jgi:hypothetical protein
MNYVNTGRLTRYVSCAPVDRRYPGNLSSPAGEHQRRSDPTAVQGGGDVEMPMCELPHGS